MMSPSAQCYIPSHKVIGPLVLEKKIFEDFYHIWVWRPSWSCDPDPANKLPFPHATEALIGQAVLDKKIFENGGRRRRTEDGPWLYYKLTNEPKGSGELIKGLTEDPIKTLCLLSERESDIQRNRSPVMPFCRNLNNKTLCHT